MATEFRDAWYRPHSHREIACPQTTKQEAKDAAAAAAAVISKKAAAEAHVKANQKASAKLFDRKK